MIFREFRGFPSQEMGESLGTPPPLAPRRGGKDGHEKLAGWLAATRVYTGLVSKALIDMSIKTNPCQPLKQYKNVVYNKIPSWLMDVPITGRCIRDAYVNALGSLERYVERSKK